MHPDNFTITTAHVTDASALTALSIVTFRDTFEKDNRAEDMDKYVAEQMTVAQLTKELNDTSSVFFLMHDGTTLMGYAKMRTSENPDGLHATNPIEIERIYIAKDYHGKRAGASLMQHCVDHANKDGHDALWLGVWEHNTRARLFYERWGFRLFGEHVFLLGDDEQTDVLMKLHLQPAHH